MFSSTPPENSGGAENLAEKAGPDSQKFFCYMYEYSLQHPAWVAEINVTACNSAGLPLFVLLLSAYSPFYRTI
jgi:hypothetical protein